MATTYANLVTLVRNWSNRDLQVLSDSIIQDCLRYAADTAYRSLMIPPLEFSTYYVLYEGDIPQGLPTNYEAVELESTSVSFQRGFAKLPIPADLVKYIHIRSNGLATVTENTRNVVTANNQIVRNNQGRNEGIVFNEKADVRTFYDLEAEKYNINLWSRQQDCTLLAGTLQDLQIIELYYYRRLAGLNATFQVTQANINLGVVTFATAAPTDMISEAVASDNTLTYVDSAGMAQTPTTGFWVRQHVPNWLRDENEKVLLFGALWHAFDFLGDEADAQKYQQKFLTALTELNQEDKDRMASGGNVQVNFNGRGLI